MDTRTADVLLRWRGGTPARVVAVVVPLAVCGLLYLVRDRVAAASAVLVLVLCIVAVAATGDRLAGVVAALSGGVWFDFFLTEPYLRLTIDDRDDLQAAVLLVLIGLSVTELAIRGRRQQEQASRRSGYLDGVLSSRGHGQRGESGPDEVVRVVASHIADVLGADTCRFVAGPPRRHPRRRPRPRRRAHPARAPPRRGPDRPPGRRVRRDRRYVARRASSGTSSSPPRRASSGPRASSAAWPSSSPTRSPRSSSPDPTVGAPSGRARQVGVNGR